MCRSGREPVHEGRVELPGQKIRLAQDLQVQRHRRLDPVHDRHFERSPHAGDRLPPIPPEHAGEHLPRGSVRQWARWCRSRDYILSEGRVTSDRFAAYRGHLRAYLFADDRIAPLAAVRALLSFYLRADIRVRNTSA
jgi:hypothetical protein